ncbi:MAG: hypothetical protein AB7N65_13940, partial [Vicinamibacterales bacterium]
MKAIVARFGVAALLLTGSACGREPAARPAEPATATPTFTRDVAPLLYSRCAPCHNPDGSAPFSVLDYGSVSPRAAAIADVTSRGVMPP